MQRWKSSQSGGRQLSNEKTVQPNDQDGCQYDRPVCVIRDPKVATVERGEILVAPSTGPGWTPLFLNAAGLVSEVGGFVSLGAVVAQEYGLPAVVSVPEATKRI